MNNTKIAVIVGGNSGVGKRTATDLAKQNFTIVLVARSAAKGSQAVQEIKNQTGNPNVEFIAADLSTHQAVTQLGEQLATRFDHIDVLVSSLGVMQNSQHLTANGYDQNFVLNYLTHFWVINTMLPLLKQAPQGRILLIGALPMLVKRLIAGDPRPVPAATKYSGMQVTGEALVGRLLLTKKLAATLQNNNVTINIFHPGNVPDSSYGTESAGLLLRIVGPIMARFSKKNVPIGAQLATDPNLSTVSGQFFNESGKVIPMPAALSLEAANKWWDISKSL